MSVSGVRRRDMEAESDAGAPAEGSPPRPLGALSPSFSPSSPASPVPPRQGWPEAAGLSELVSVPAFAALLVDLGGDSLALFGENIDLGEGHGEQLRAVLQALPSKPKKAKAKRNRCIRELEDLLTASCRTFELWEGCPKRPKRLRRMSNNWLRDSGEPDAQAN